MKSILMSIKPEWVEKILNGKKTIEVRKTRPKIDTPFKVYIYCTKGKNYLFRHFDKKYFFTAKGNFQGKEYAKQCMWNGKVVAEFTCDNIEYVPNIYYNDNELVQICNNTCLIPSEIYNYMGDSIGCYKWHISNLKIYEEPKDLQDFINCTYWRDTPKPKCYPDNCQMCNYSILTKAPQSWCYVEELK